MLRVVLAGGGTAGHVNPALALAESLRGCDITFLGTARGAEAKLVPAAGWRLEIIEVRGWDRARPLTLLSTGYAAARAVVVAARILRRRRADVVVGMGGYVSLPACLAARALGVPVVVHEQNVVLGLANRVCKPFARRVAVSFEESVEDAGARAAFVGNPVASEIAHADLALQRRRGLQRFSLEERRRTLLVFGGSQGARRINDAAAGLRSLWRNRGDRQIVHISGVAPETVEPEEPGQLLYRKVRFVDRMVEAYAVADLALCRGGATTVAELAAVGLPAIVVPYPHHRDRQQERHGRIMERAGAAVVIADQNATGESVGVVADGILSSEETLPRMRRAAESLAVRDAAERLAALVREAAA